MNLCRCERGHFYDKEKYATCPHCAGGSASDGNLTEAFTSDFTVPMNQQAQPQPQPPVTPAMQTPPVVPEPTPLPEAPTLPVAGMSASQMTVAAGISYGDTPTVPLDDMIKTISTGNDADDDHTVGIFDEAFAAEAGTSKKSSAGGAAQKAVNKVSTPCVGWLIALGGEHIGTDFRLKVGKNFVGRSLQMDVALTEDKSVSRERHAIVVYEPKAHLYLVQPGESSSLVYRNNEVVLTPVRLEAYDVITVGDVDLLFIPLCGEKFNWGDLIEAMKKKNK